MVHGDHLVRAAGEDRLDHGRAGRGDRVARDQVSLLDHLAVLRGDPVPGQRLEALECGRSRLTGRGRTGPRTLVFFGTSPSPHLLRGASCVSRPLVERESRKSTGLFSVTSRFLRYAYGALLA